MFRVDAIVMSFGKKIFFLLGVLTVTFGWHPACGWRADFQLRISVRSTSREGLYCLSARTSRAIDLILGCIAKFTQTIFHSFTLAFSNRSKSPFGDCGNVWSRGLTVVEICSFRVPSTLSPRVPILLCSTDKNEQMTDRYLRVNTQRDPI